LVTRRLGQHVALASIPSVSLMAAVAATTGVDGRMPEFTEAYLGLGWPQEPNEKVKAGEAYGEAARLDPDLWLAEIKIEALGGQ
jgi:hypothetical protein